MQENYLTEATEDFTIDVGRVLEHSEHQFISNLFSLFYFLLRDNGLSQDSYKRIINAQYMCRNQLGKNNAIIEMFGKEDSMSKLRPASYNLETFFKDISGQMNNFLSLMPFGEVVFELDRESEYSASFDAKRVCTIIYHLVSNSLEHGKTDNKTVKIKCKKIGDIFELSVIDHGGGIPKAVQSKMYTKFIDEFNIKKQKLGLFPPITTGIGLPLCKKIAAAMKGEITFRNISKGAKFTLTIPQTDTVLREESEYLFDDKLMLSCMSFFTKQTLFED